MEEEISVCLECKNEVEAQQPVCCESCYERLKKDIRSLLHVKQTLEEALDAKSN